VAARRPVVEKAAREFEEGVKVRAVLDSLAVGRLRATSIVKGFADAMMGLLVAVVIEERELVDLDPEIRSLDWIGLDSKWDRFDWPT